MRLSQIVNALALLGLAWFLYWGLTDGFAGWGLDRAESVALAIAAIAATLWITELVPLYVTSMAVLMLALTWLLPALGEAGSEANAETFRSVFFADVILLFLGGFVMSAALHQYGIDALIAHAILRRTGGSVGKLTAAIIAVTAVFSMFLSNTATAAMMLTMCIPIVDSLPSNDKSRRSILLAIPFAANIGGIGTPIGTPPNAIALDYMHRHGTDIEFAEWMLIGVPIALVLAVLLWFLLRLQGRGGSTTLPMPEEAPPMPWNAKRWVVTITSAVTVLGWLFGKKIGLSNGTVALIPVIVLFGSRILLVRHLRNMSWDVLLLMGGGLCLGRIMTYSGLADSIIGALPAGDDPATAMLALAAFCGMATLLSSLMSNTAAATLILPIAIGLAASGESAVPVAIAMACSVAMPLPISTPPNAMAFATGAISSFDLLKSGLIITLLGLLIVLATGALRM